ncbi:MAG: hypothetical protein ACQEXJ_14075 [Myxococcota bacterium]
MPVADGEGTLLTNIAGGAISFCHDEGYVPGTHLALEMEVPGLPAGILALGTVVWTRPNGSPATHEIGAELHWVGWNEDEAQRTIADRITTALSGDA